MPADRHNGRETLGRAAAAAVVIVLVLVALLMLNRIELDREIPGPELRFLNTHDVQLDRTGTVVRAGSNDPWLELALPPRVTPLSEFTLRVRLLAPLGEDFRLYFVPQGGTTVAFDERCTRQPLVTERGGVTTLTWKIETLSSTVRIDPPDQAQFQIEAARIRVHPFGGLFWLDFAELVVLILVLAAVVWSAGGLVEALRTGVARLAQGGLVLVVAAVALRLWLVIDRGVECVGYYPHDDLLFLRLARSIVQGEWLGAYNNVTLVKGPLYPLWIAGAFLLGLPLLLSQQLGYIAACGLAVRALRPVLADARLRGAVFVWLVFNPASFSANETSRVLRNTVAALLALAALGLLTGAVARLRGEPGRLARWSAAGGVLLGLFWLTREEAVWLLAPVGLFGAFAAWELWRRRPADWPVRAIWLFGLPLAGWGVVVGGVCALNHHYYGWWGTVESRSAEFADAYGALSRVQPPRWRPHIPLARGQWPQVGAVSPAYQELRSYLEGPAGAHWAAADLAETNPPGLPEVPAGAFIWAVRDAAEAAGHHRSPAEAQAFYRRLAAEVNRACAAGRLPAGPARSGFLPPWRSEYTRALPGTWFRAWRYVLAVQGFEGRSRPSADGPAEIEALYRDLTHTPLAPHRGEAGPPLQNRWLELRARVGAGVAVFYGQVLPWLFAVAVVALTGAAGLLVAARRIVLSAVAAAAALGGAAAVVTIVTLVDVTSFVAVDMSYLAPAYPLVLWFVALSGVALRDAWQAWLQRRTGVTAVSGEMEP